MIVPLLKVENLTLNFGGLKAIDDLSLEVNQGEIFSVIGPNGAGKTSLFNCISGFYGPSSGKILFRDKSLVNMKPHNICRIGLIRTFQNLRIFGNMTVEENVMSVLYCRTKANVFDALLHTKRHKKEEQFARDAARDYLNMVELYEHKDRIAKNLPYGAQKRLEIARALAIKPIIIMLDEPAAGLNHSEKDDLMTLVRKIQGMGITVLLIEHDMGVIMRISERIIVLNYGKKIAEGNPMEVRTNPAVVEAYLGRQG